MSHEQEPPSSQRKRPRSRQCSSGCCSCSLCSKSCLGAPSVPPPPQLPLNFCWCGRYIVPDLGIEVPFWWVGNNGNMQMIAGSFEYPIYFTNVIFNNQL